MKYLIQILFALVFISQLTAQNFSSDTMGLWQFAFENAEKNYPNTLKYWEAFEKRAETAWLEKKTKAYAFRHFKNLQKKYGRDLISIDTLAGGVFVEIEGSSQSEHTLFIRCEMDALFFPATDSLPAEKKHSCAHSVGLSVACSLAEVLLTNRSFHWKKVCFLITASEEATPSGTRKMLEILQKRGFSRFGKIVALGQHMSVGDVDNHSVEVSSKVAQASSQILRIYLDFSTQKGGHIQSEQNINPIEVWDTMKLMIAERISVLRAGLNTPKPLLRWTNTFTSCPPSSPVNVICDKLTVFGGFRTFSSVLEVEGMKSIDSVLTFYNEKYKSRGLKFSRADEELIPCLENDSTLTEAIRYRGSIYLKKNIDQHHLRYGADDHAVFKLFGIPAVLLRVGIDADGNLHKRDFNLRDRTILKTSLGLFTYLVYSLNP